MTALPDHEVVGSGSVSHTRRINTTAADNGDTRRWHRVRHATPRQGLSWSASASQSVVSGQWSFASSCWPNTRSRRRFRRGYGPATVVAMTTQRRHYDLPFGGTCWRCRFVVVH